MYCTKCGKENKDDAVFCVFCGANQVQRAKVEVIEKPPKTKRVFWIVAIVALIVVTFAIIVPIGICALIGFNEEQESQSLVITDSSMTHDIFGYAEVTVTVENTGESEVTWHSITAKFYNSDDLLIYTGSAYIENLASREKAQFSISCFEKGAARYVVFVD